jgi:DNA-binding transcriptional LysR family regulator
VNLRQLELFVAVVEAGSFSRGAEAASLTQSTVSQHIAALESEVELQLLDRTGQGVVMTHAGELFLQHARKVLAQCVTLRQAMSGFRGLQQVSLTVGASNIPANYLIPAILPRLSAENPGIELTMHTGDSREMLNSLLADNVEVAVIGNRSDERGVDYLPLTSDLLVLVVSSKHPWSRRQEITLHDLAKSPLIVRERGSGSNQALQQALRHAGFDLEQLQVAVRLGSNEAVRQTVLSGFGAAFISEISIRQELKRGDLIKVPVVGFTVKRQFWLATRKQRTVSPAAQVFSRLVQESFTITETSTAEDT